MKAIRYFFLPLFILLCSICVAQTKPKLPNINVDHSYGKSCGFTRLVPAYRDSIEGFIKRKKFEDVARWLRSDEEVKAVYAIEALSRIKDECKPTEEQKHIIAYYKENDVQITCCGSGIPEKCSSKVVLKKFRF